MSYNANSGFVPATAATIGTMAMTSPTATVGSGVGKATISTFALGNIPSGKTVITNNAVASGDNTSSYAYFEFSGVQGIDVATGFGVFTVGVNVYNSGTVATNHSSEAWVGACCVQGTPAGSPGGSWTFTPLSLGGATVGAGAGYQLGAAQGNMVFTGSAPVNVATAVALALQPASSGPVADPVIRSSSFIPVFTATSL